MLRTVNFNNKSSLMTVEVCDIVINNPLFIYFDGIVL